jgi:hypothetical protein
MIIADFAAQRKEDVIETVHNLFAIISQISAQTDKYVYQPTRQFTRNRLISLARVVELILTMSAGSLNNELMSEVFLENSGVIPTVSAFCQKRQKIRPELFRDMFDEHKQLCPQDKTWRNRRVFACDGSDLLYPKDPTDIDCAHGEYSSMHVNTLYDVLNDVI